MAVAITVKTISPEGSLGSSGGLVYAFGTLALSGSYAAGGDGPLSFAGLGPAGAQIPSSQSPLFVTAWGIGGYSYAWVPASGKLKVLSSTGQAGSATLAAGAATVTFGTAFQVAPFIALGPTITGNTYKVTAITATGFTITSSLGTDTSAVNWIALDPATASQELGAGAYPAGVTGDVVNFEAAFLLFA